MADGYIRVPADSVGKLVDTNEVTRPDASVVERQRMEIPGTVTIDADVLQQVLVELKLHSILFANAFGVTDDLDALRSSL